MHESISNCNDANDLLSHQLLQTAFTQKFGGVLFYCTEKKSSGQAFKNHSQSTVCLHLITRLERLILGLCFVLYCSENTILKIFPFKMH